MIVQILSGRKEQYQFLEAMYRGTAEFFFDANWELAEAAERIADVFLIDPELTIRDSYTSVQVKRWMTEGYPVLICAPERKKSLVRELRSVGIETGALIPEESEGLDPYPGEKEKKEEGPVRPDYRYVFGIVELTNGADAGLVTMMMAEELASEMQEDHGLVTVYAPEHSCFYYSLGLESKLGDAGFQRIDEYMSHLMENAEEDDFREIPNLLEGISWLTAAGHALKREEHQERSDYADVKNPIDSQCDAPFSAAENQGDAVCEESAGHGEHAGYSECLPQKIRRSSVTRMLQGNVLLSCYSAGQFEQEVQEAADCLDAILVVTDARPSSLKEGAEHLKRIRESGLPVVFAVSGVNESVRQTLVSQILETEEMIWLPEIDSAVRYEAEYREENPYRFEAVRKVMMLPISQMIEQLKAVGSGLSSDVHTHAADLSGDQ